MRVLILGDGLSGRSASDYLESLGYETEFAKKELLNENFLALKGEIDRLFSGLSFIVVSPGISKNIPLIKEAKRRKIKVIGELELGASKIKGDIIAVTGTNGKTTTVSLIYFLLKDYFKKSYVGGNIGIPVTSFALQTKKEDIVVLECSSFQLETAKKFKPHIACILNITEDHLNRHKTMNCYIKEKCKIAKNLTPKDYLILNADSEILMENIPKTKAKIYYFSTRKRVFGCYIKNNCIYFNDNQNEKKLLSLKNIKLVGEHNLANILCACFAVFLQTNDLELLKTVSSFQGVEHRIEYVKTINRIEFYNDSKATNIDSTLVAVKSFKNGINLILGGSDKGNEYDEIFAKLPKNVRNIAVFGETKQKILNSALKYNFKNIYSCDTLKSATHLCFKLAKPKEIILLSPACASYDQFKNYEERGSVFKKIIAEICDEDISCMQKTP